MPSVEERESAVDAAQSSPEQYLRTLFYRGDVDLIHRDGDADAGP